jgi:hypothetical protein
MALKDQKISRLRKKRLLYLARHGGDHKRWYSQYCELIKQGLVTWTLGMAFLTDDGAIELYELERE